MKLLCSEVNCGLCCFSSYAKANQGAHESWWTYKWWSQKSFTGLYVGFIPIVELFNSARDGKYRRFLIKSYVLIIFPWHFCGVSLVIYLMAFHRHIVFLALYVNHSTRIRYHNLQTVGHQNWSWKWLQSICLIWTISNFFVIHNISHSLSN